MLHATQAFSHVGRSLAGGICLSGWAAMQDQYSTLIHPANKGTPLFWGHGGADPTVVTACQAAGVKALEEAGMAVQAETYAGLGHGESEHSSYGIAATIVDT